MISFRKLELWVILTLAILTVTSAGGNKGYGEECSLDEISGKDPCNEDEYLICKSGKCGCTGDMVYEEDVDLGTGGCFASANNGICPSKENADFKVKCVANAICDGDWGLSSCKCKEGYHATPEGHCAEDNNKLTTIVDDSTIAQSAHTNRHHLNDNKSQKNGDSLLMTSLINLGLALAIVFFRNS